MSTQSEIPPLALDSSYNGQPAFNFTAIFLVVQIAFVALRYLSKALINGRWHLDDALVLISLVLQISLAAITFDALVSRSVGYHQLWLEFNHPDRLTHWFKELYALIFIYDFTAILPKLAILVFYNRVFGEKKNARIQIRILIAILSLYMVVLAVLDFVICIPIAANWDQNIPGAKCLNKGVIAAWVVLPNILTDIWMLILPIPVIWRLQTTKRLKVALTFNFLIGSIGLIASVSRFVISLTTSTADETWQAAKLLIFLQLEPGAYLISACLPTLRPLLDQATNWLFITFPPANAIKTKVAGGTHTGASNVTRDENSVQPAWRPQVPSQKSYSRLDDEGKDVKMPARPSAARVGTGGSTKKDLEAGTYHDYEMSRIM